MKKKEEEVAIDLDIEDSLPVKEVDKKEFSNQERVSNVNMKEQKNDGLINCLRNERIVVRHINKPKGLVTNPKHILFGGMAESAVRVFVTPRLTSGMFVNVLTDSEKAFLEDIMGLEYNALSIYKKKDNYWDDSNENANSRVRLTKQDNYLNLADPNDYIKYKILLANKDFIAPSMKALEDTPKATYQFVIISEGEETRVASDNMSATMKCYMKFGEIQNNSDKLRVIIEILTGKPTSANVKPDFLKTEINKLIQADSKLFLRIVEDPLLDTKVLIKQSIEAGLISVKGNYLYLTSDNTPLCEMNEEPTMNIAARYLNLPKRQAIKFSLEAQLKK